jgi:Zn-dependent peptidase ImmA (M78 family)/transcriptional regulator with XRE-family HTH domain
MAIKTTSGGAKRPLAKPIPERIKEAREARGFTLDGFADALGVTRQAVAQYETGLSAPSGETMAKIIALTEQPLAFFTTLPARAGDPRAMFWRSLKRMEAHHRRRIMRRVQWACDIATLVDRFVELPPANLPHLEFDPETADDDDIEAAAEKLRDHWRLGRGPITDLAAILEENGVILVREPVRCADMDAVSCWLSGRPFVLLSAEVVSGPRDLFNLSHEIAHMVLHSDVEINSENLAKIEKQAHRFASAFLMPRETFSQEVLGTSIEYFKSLKRRWGTAIAAMAYRCKDLEILNDNQFSYIFRQMSIAKIRKIEPLDNVIPVSSPTLLGEAIKMMIEHRVYSRDQIERALGLNLRDVESICGLSEGYLDTRVVRVQFRPSVDTNDNENAV